MIENKIVLVTGGSGLLGKAMISDLKQKGAIALNLDVNVENSEDARTYRCDITSDESISQVIYTIVKKYERIDGLVNNAYPRTTDWGKYDFENTPPNSWRQNIDWQLNSHAIMCQKVVEHMKRQKNGSIVNIASIYGIVGNDFTIYEGTNMMPAAAYSATKGGLINLTRYLASLYGEFGVRFNCVSPGGIFDNQPEPFLKAYEKKVPMKRMGTPEDIAPAVTFLLSDYAKYITGQNLAVDGGWTAI